MAHSHRPAFVRPARAVRPGFPFARVLAAGLFTALSYAALTSGVLDPASEQAAVLPAKAEVIEAKLSFAGPDPVITGSVDHLFKSAGFTGPNRAEKTDRIRPQVDVLALSRSFDEARVQLAALRAGPADAPELGQSRIADAAIEGPAANEDGPRMSVASINPTAAAALDAIAGIAPTNPLNENPIPALASEQLAYARANAPQTGAYSEIKPLKVSDKELWCLATAIYFEARGEVYRGQVAVAQVVLNRVKDHRYPNTICGVVFQNQNKRNACQFSFACDGIPETIADRKSWAQAEDIAERFVDGQLYLTEVADATHYHATYVSPAWAPRMEKLTQVGLHVFYKFKRGWLFG